jgi:hypothetical protein
MSWCVVASMVPMAVAPVVSVADPTLPVFLDLVLEATRVLVHAHLQLQIVDEIELFELCYLFSFCPLFFFTLSFFIKVLMKP